MTRGALVLGLVLVGCDASEPIDPSGAAAQRDPQLPPPPAILVPVIEVAADRDLTLTWTGLDTDAAGNPVEVPDIYLHITLNPLVDRLTGEPLDYETALELAEAEALRTDDLGKQLAVLRGDGEPYIFPASAFPQDTALFGFVSDRYWGRGSFLLTTTGAPTDDHVDLTDDLWER